MTDLIVQSMQGVTLVGGGPFSAADLALAMVRAPVAVAADGGGDRMLRAGVMPEAVIGDFDSLSDEAKATIPQARQHLISEQSTTDFDKCLRSVSAPFILALGFAGARMDHGLAAFNTLIRHPAQRCIIVGSRDIVFVAPTKLDIAMRPGDRFSLFPMAPTNGQSEGLEWPITGLAFAPDGQIGTSNRVLARGVRLAFDQPGMLVIIARNRLDAAIRALTAPV